ncbi:MAG: hypothetical protein CSA22_07505 [Deltaproteobacteria bacterium]|nr:MAG: hypothetical protein CSA22_07505 [Deltaproteobacteria bacterium]
MKICIYYYSGAGNTACISEIISQIAQAKGYAVYRKRITKKTLETIQQEYDILAIGFPVYFRRAPLIVLDFINRQLGKNRRFFMFSTKGLYSGDASKEIQILAKERFFTCIGNMEFYMPGSDVLALMAKKNSLTEKIFKCIHSNHIKTRIEGFINSLDDLEKIEDIKSKWYMPLDNGIIKPLERHFTDSYQVFIGRFEAHKTRCDLCLHCVKNCPNFNISIIDHAIVFGTDCSFCLRCIHQCHRKAIEIKGKTEGKVRYHPVVTPDLSVNFTN